MSKKSIVAFTELVKNNPTILNELKTKTSYEEIIKIAAGEGFIISYEDIQEMKSSYKDPHAVPVGANDKTCASGYCVW